MKQKGFAQILIFLIVIVIVGVVGYLGYKHWKSVPSQLPIKSPMASNELQTYSDDSFSFKYPNDISVDKNYSRTGLVDMTNHVLLSMISRQPFGFTFTLGLYKNIGNLSVKQFIQQYFNPNNFDANGKLIDPDLKNMTFTQKTFNGIDMTFIDGLAVVRGYVGPAVWFTRGTDAYFGICDGGSCEQSTLDEIFSTFKFIK